MRLLTFYNLLSLVVLMQIAQGTENTEEKPMQKPEVSTEAPSSNDATQAESESLKETNKNMRWDHCVITALIARYKPSS